MRLVSRSFVLLLILAAATVAHAQVQTGSILVKASDEDLMALYPGLDPPLTSRTPSCPASASRSAVRCWSRAR